MPRPLSAVDSTSTEFSRRVAIFSNSDTVCFGAEIVALQSSGLLLLVFVHATQNNVGMGGWTNGRDSDLISIRPTNTQLT